MPELVLVELDPTIGRAEPDPEIQDLLLSSDGLNLGVDFLPGALPFSPAAGPPPDPDFAADVVWLDALVTNVDRTAQNPNLLWWHERLWLIDHGAALYFHHADDVAPEHARGRFEAVRDHVLLPYASSDRGRRRAAGRARHPRDRSSGPSRRFRSDGSGPDAARCTSTTCSDGSRRRGSSSSEAEAARG